MLRNIVSNLNAETLLAKTDTLAALPFASEAKSLDEGLPDMRVEQLSDESKETGGTEAWLTDNPVLESGRDDDCHWRRTKNLQFVALAVPLPPSDDYETTAYRVYQTLLRFIETSPHSKLLRFWNYIPKINHGAGDNENYKRFCAGRLKAFREHKLEESRFPAASAVGHYTDGMTVYALTASSSATHHANPRQVDAFKYPRQYGLSSPSFARATTIEIDNKRLCFISGTASILGHSSVHQDDLRLQLYTTNDNILYLLKETSFKRSSIQTLRVYLRHVEDYVECKRIVEELYPNTNAIYTHADICRADLLVEIECFCVAEPRR